MDKIQKLLKEVIKRKKIVIPLAVIIAIIIVSRIISVRNNQPQYQTETVQKGTIVSTISASGNVLTANIINIVTNATGVVKKIDVKDGDTVVAGQKIADIELDQAGQQRNSSAWSSYLLAKNSVDSASATAYSLRSTKDIAWKKFYDLSVGSAYQNADGLPKELERNSSSEFQSLQADWLAGEAKYKNQAAVIEQTKASLNSSWLLYQVSSPTVFAPISGTVTNISLVEGMTLAFQDSSTDSISSQRVAVIQREGNPILSFNLTEIDVPKIKIGQKATVTLDSISGKTFTGKITTVDRIGTITNGVTNYLITIKLDTESPEIFPNMAATTNIIIETKSDVLLVPSA
ncbi:MAG: efflux RND transporter periplasmic adaptor subunit, partial [bacterium]|nr:efflux RND transporter periplasmic adaptor subunit [bacterium]